MNRIFKFVLPAVALVFAGAAQAYDSNDYHQPDRTGGFSVSSQYGQDDNYYSGQNGYQAPPQRHGYGHHQRQAQHRSYQQPAYGQQHRQREAYQEHRQHEAYQDHQQREAYQDHQQREANQEHHRQDDDSADY